MENFPDPPMTSRELNLVSTLTVAKVEILPPFNVNRSKPRRAKTRQDLYGAGIRIFCPGKIKSALRMTSRLASKILGYSFALP